MSAMIPADARRDGFKVEVAQAAVPAPATCATPITGFTFACA